MRLRFGGPPLDCVPDWVREAAYAAFDWREPHLQVARLISDSLLDARRVPKLGTRRLRFVAGTRIVDVSVTARLNGLGVRFRVTPVEILDIDVRHASTRILRGAGAGTGVGLTVDGLQPGVVSFLVRWPTGDLLRTAWVRL